jgi:hypothetical protein
MQSIVPSDTQQRATAGVGKQFINIHEHIGAESLGGTGIAG